MNTKENNKYDPDDQIRHDLKTDQTLLAASAIAGSVNATVAPQPTAEDYAANVRNIAERDMVERDIETGESECDNLRKEADEHIRLIKPENTPKFLGQIIAYFVGIVLLGGAILVNTSSYALRIVDSELMAWAFALSVLGIAAGKELAIQSSPDTVKAKAQAISKIGLLVSAVTYVWAFVDKFGMEQALDAQSLLTPTDDRLLLGSQICSEIFIFSLLASGIVDWFYQRRFPVGNSRRSYFDNLIERMTDNLDALGTRRLDLEEKIVTFEVKRKRYEAFCKSVGK